MTNAIIGWGGTVEKSTDTGTTWVKFIEAKAPIPPETSDEFVEVTSLDSPDRSREYIRGLRENSEIEIPQNYTADGYKQQYQDQQSGNLIMYKITFSDGVTFEFSGFPTVKISDAPIDNAVQMVTTIRVSGALTVTFPT